MMQTLMAYVDLDVKQLHQLLQKELNFNENGIPLPKKERGYNFSFEVRQLIHRLAVQHGIKLKQ